MPVPGNQDDHRLASNLIDNIIIHFHESGGSVLIGVSGPEVNGIRIDSQDFLAFITEYAEASGVDLEPRVAEMAVNYLHKLSPPQLYRSWNDLAYAIRKKRERAIRNHADQQKLEEIYNKHIQTIKAKENEIKKTDIG